MNKGILSSLLALALAAAATSAHAVPAFARKYDTNCSSCHTAYPQLNKAGRKFKEAGYVFPKLKGEETISDFLHFDEYFPASAVIVSRPYDKKSDSDEKLRAIHEVELMVAGRFYKKVSGFFEMEAEDEDTNSRGFELGIPAAWLTYNHNKAFNVGAVWGSLLAMDPYDTYSGARRLTRGTQSIITNSFGGADGGGAIDSSRQSVSLFGRPMDNVFYNVGVGGLAEDSEGENARTFFGRVAVDVIPEAMVGLLYMNGTCEECTGTGTPDFDFERVGVDAQAEFGDARVMGAWLTATDDVSAVAEDDNDAWYLQGEYIVKKDGRPWIVPLARYDSFEKNDGMHEVNELTLNLGYYFTQNIKGYLEYHDVLDDEDDPTNEISRITLQFVAAF